MRLAQYVDGEVINFDSVQIYQGIQIATAKPSEEEKQGIPHHLIGYVDPNINYTSADWARDAAEKIGEVEQRGKVPILVGGTGFYLRTLMNPLFESPKTDLDLRDRLTKIKEDRGPEHLHRMLTRIDPEAAAKLFPRDAPRIMRALEVFFQTGERISDRQPDRAETPEFASRIQIFVLNPDRKELYNKIDLRAQAHFDADLVGEVKLLLANRVNERGNALGAHGYRRVCEYLRGERLLESAIEKSKQDVRNYAKRQLTWFRREKNAIWLDGFGEDRKVWETLLSAINK